MQKLTTPTLMRQLFSEAGIIAFSDHDLFGFENAEVVESCINYATAFIGGKLARLFPLAALATAPMIREFATVIAVRTLCTRRGNPIPESLEMRYQEIVQKDGLLDQILYGQMNLIDDDGNLLAGKSFAPTMSNMTVDRRFNSRKVRVRQGNSTTVNTPLRRDVASFTRDNNVY